MTAPLTPRRHRVRRRRRRVVFFLVIVVIVGVAFVVGRRAARPGENPLRARIVSVAQGQLGYRTDPSSTYCNRYSAYWDAGSNDCGNANLSEEWCADFAAWVWKQAGAQVSYELAPGFLNAQSASFYVWGMDHHTWHAVGSGYVAQPGDVAVYGLNYASVTADHVAVVVSAGPRDDAPNVVNGDGDRTGYSVVEAGRAQTFADVKGKGGRLSGYVSPSSPPTT
jgi:hypothetical protein